MVAPLQEGQLPYFPANYVAGIGYDGVFLPDKGTPKPYADALTAEIHRAQRPLVAQGKTIDIIV